MQATVLSIAGSDPTGGAGIQADIKTMTSVGVYAASVITCITVQNSHGVTRIKPLSKDLIEEQISAVLEDHFVTHIKIGMIGTLDIAEAINHALSGYCGEVVLDPVLSSTTGHALMDHSGINELCSLLISKTTVLTPNIPELQILSCMQTHKDQDTICAAEKLFNKFDRLRAILVKGGHTGLKKDINDIMVYRSAHGYKSISVTHPRIESRNTHGTGCTLASAFTAFHSITGDDEISFRSAVGYLHNALKRSATIHLIRNHKGRGGLLYHPAAPGVCKKRID